MSISYPLTPPSELKFAELRWQNRSIVGTAPSIFTGQTYVQAAQGQWWEVEITTPQASRATIAPILAWLVALNGKEGTFTLGDKICATPRGTIAGSVTVDTGATRGSTTLPITGGTGTFALGDWLQVSTSLYMVTKLNSGSVDVFPRLRASYAEATPVVHTNPVGLFRLQAEVPWAAGGNKLYRELSISAIEALPTS